MRYTEKQIVENPIVNRIIETMKARSISQNELIEYVGLGNGAFTRWKYDGSTSYMKYIDKISDCLNVSKEYLLYGKKEKEEEFDVTLLPSEIATYKKLHELTSEQRNYIYGLIDVIWKANNQL